LAGLAGTVLQRIYRQLRLPSPPLVTPYIVTQMSNDYILDVTKIKERLGYSPAYDYEQGFARLSLYRQNSGAI
jgi:nucleoside-diphosphate-sugar epimerase